MPRRRKRIARPFVLTIVLIVGAIAMYVFGLAWLQSMTSLASPSSLWVPRSIEVLVFVWLFWVGSSIGSFLNVVAWRMPRGQYIGGRSHCPRCDVRLSARDNFPVFGWLALGGRCRTCRLPISPRYPIVEAVVGMSISLVGMAELYRLSLPNQVSRGYPDPLWTPVIDRSMWLILLYHVVALASAWALGLIRMDGKRLPSRLIAFAMNATILPMLAYPTLMVVPWQTSFPAEWQPDGLYLDAAMRVLTALAMAVVVARYLARSLCPGADPKLDPLGKRTSRLIDLIVILSVPAIVVGWQAIGMMVVAASLLALPLKRWLGRSDALGRFAVAMPVVLAIQLMLWRWLHQFWLWPSAGSSPGVILFSLALLFVTPLWLRESPDFDAPAPPPEDTSEHDEVEEDDDDFDEDDDSDEGGGESNSIDTEDTTSRAMPDRSEEDADPSDSSQRL